MSHFTVLVIGENPEEQMAPYQENNMGDCPKEYLEFCDEEEGYLKEYNNDSKSMIKMPNGDLKSPYDEIFKKTDPEASWSHSYEIPIECKKVEVLFKEVYSTFEEFMEDWAGYDEKDPETGKFGYWENPNRKWDWYQMGGRWSGYFQLKKIPFLAIAENLVSEFGFSNGEVETLMKLFKEDGDKFEELVSKYGDKGIDIKEEIESFIEGVYANGEVGDPSLLGSNRDSYIGRADQARKRAIDFEDMRNQAGDGAAKDYDIVLEAFGGVIPKVKAWSDIIDSEPGLSIDEKRDLYHKQDGVIKWDEIKKSIWYNKEDEKYAIFTSFYGKIDYFQITREKYIKNARDAAISSFAIVKDGKWYEKGEMGWWACVSNAKNEADWNKEFSKLIDGVDDDTLFTVYDCHI